MSTRLSNEVIYNTAFKKATNQLLYFGEPKRRALKAVVDAEMKRKGRKLEPVLAALQKYLHAWHTTGVQPAMIRELDQSFTAFNKKDTDK